MANYFYSKWWQSACASWLLVGASMLTSCEQNLVEEGSLVNQSARLEALAADTSGWGPIVPIAESPLKQFQNQKPAAHRSAAANDLTPSDLYDIADFPINLIVKENNTGQLFLTSQGENQVLTFGSENTGNLNQRFSLGILPLTGYVIIKTADGKLVSAGQYTNQPGVDVLYVKPDNSTIGASWNFRSGQVTSGSFILENADVLGFDGPEPTFGNVYNKVIGSQGNSIYFDKYRNQAKQEFEISLLDDFEVQGIQYINDATASVTRIPDFIVNWTYTNGSSVQQSITTDFGQKASKTSTFANKNTFTAKVSTSVKVGIPFIANGQISTELTGATESTYGGSEGFEDTRNYNIPLLVPANTRITATATVARYQMNVNYIATLRGRNTGKIVRVAGTWSGVDCTDINVGVQQTNLRTMAVVTMPTVKVVDKNNQ
ncbi:ETX/MTX2 family pore-forming toxin [Spirosoma pomorum]